MQPQLIRRDEWTDWQRSAMTGRFMAACMESALDRAMRSWAEELDRHQNDIQRVAEAARIEREALQQEAESVGRQTGLNQWLEHLMVWTHYRRSRLASLREDMAQLLSEVLGQVLSATPPSVWMPEVLARLDPLVDGQHTLLILVSDADHAQAVDAVEQWWKSAGWCGGTPRVQGDPKLMAGQCRLVSAAGEVLVDLPGLVKAFELCVLPAASSKAD